MKNIFYSKQNNEVSSIQKECKPLLDRAEEVWYIIKDLLMKSEKSLENPVSKSHTFKVEMMDDYWEEVKSGAVRV